MTDDKDGPAPDPWAGIEGDDGGQAADGFTFSFDSSAETEANPLDMPPLEQASIEPPSVPDGDEQSIIRIESSAEHSADTDVDPFPTETDQFDAFSFDGTGADAADADVAAWLDSPGVTSDADPSFDVVAAPGEQEGIPEVSDGFPGTSKGTADDVHGSADTHAVGGSHIEIGTGFSGVTSPSEIDPDGVASPIDDWAESPADDFSVDEQPSFDASGFDGVSELGDIGAEAEPHPEVDGAESVVAGIAGAVVASAEPPSRARPRTRRSGGVGQLIGIVLGGLMAIPITYAILIWGFQRDPFKLTGMLPRQLAFLLPEKFQSGAARSGAAPKLDVASPLDGLADESVAVNEPAIPAPADAEPAEPVPEESAVSPAGTTPEEKMPVDLAGTAAEPRPGQDVVEGSPPVPATPSPRAEDELFAPPKMAQETPSTEPASDLFAAADPAPAPAPAPPPAPAPAPVPEPLDTAALEAAVGEVNDAYEALAAADRESPDRKKLLKTWYRKLAAVAEQVVLLEKIASDSGRTLEGVDHVIDDMRATIANDEAVAGDLATLSGLWMSSKKRSADGAVLLGEFGGARQVGPYWSTQVTVDGPEPRTVSVISRGEPRAKAGERVILIGVLFDGDVVWASDCRPLAGRSGPGEDLF